MYRFRLRNPREAAHTTTHHQRQAQTEAKYRLHLLFPEDWDCACVHRWRDKRMHEHECPYTLFTHDVYVMLVTHLNTLSPKTKWSLLSKLVGIYLLLSAAARRSRLRTAAIKESRAGRMLGRMLARTNQQKRLQVKIRGNDTELTSITRE